MRLGQVTPTPAESSLVDNMVKLGLTSQQIVAAIQAFRTRQPRPAPQPGPLSMDRAGSIAPWVIGAAAIGLLIYFSKRR
jgi:hypothetical protein